jgi:oxidase EvaA
LPTLEAVRKTKYRLFLDSAVSGYSHHSREEFFTWLKACPAKHRFKVEKTSLADLKGWAQDPVTGNITHKSGKFFRIEGIDVTTNFGPTEHWMQPIINQPEIGILGFLVKEIDGVLHFLAQAKMEPGNINLLQISPTVQATRSNFTQVHGGQLPSYLEYFLDSDKATVLIDQLQSEQGARFLRKRNRNMIVQVENEELNELEEDFYWLTLRQLTELQKQHNLINMDTRTVLSCIRYSDPTESTAIHPESASTFEHHVLNSALAGESMALHELDSIIAWLTQLKTHYRLNVKMIPLKKVDDWICTPGKIHHKDHKFFSVIGVNVVADSREVSSWQQPLIDSIPGGEHAFLCKKFNGVLHFLVQARVEPGNFDALELAPTVQCTSENYQKEPSFYDRIAGASDSEVRFRSVQSEEGGRFYHDAHENRIIELGENESLTIPPNYIWMTLRQMKEFIRFNNYFNIEARGLISCLGIGWTS